MQAVKRDAGEYRALRLRLAVAAHGAVGHDTAVVEQRQCRVQGVEWFLARSEGVDVGRIERETGAAVLPVDAAFGEHHAAAELVINALDEAHRATFAVDHAHPHGIPRLRLRTPRRGLT